MTYIVIQKKFEQYLQSILVMYKIKKILFLFSGGQDSFVLLKLLLNLNLDKELLTCLYIDHEYQQKWKTQIHHLINVLENKALKVIIYQIKSKIFSENEARELRYQIISKFYIDKKEILIMTGHTISDQIETFWLNLLRGTGLTGLNSLHHVRLLKSNVYLLKPLLFIERINTAWLSKNFFLPIWSDNSNYIYHIKRNRLRYELIPYLIKYFSNKILFQLKKFLLLMKQEDSYLKKKSIFLLIKNLHHQSIAMKYTKIQLYHIALQMRIIKLFFYYYFNITLSFKSILFLIKTQLTCQKINYLNLDVLTICVEKHWIYVIC
uniref:tRNA(Ile)-lysidine synthase, chloroplastic n=1 Tax=Pterocladiophila hemisphaerica TaxID=2712948 RepID=A0A6M3WWN4_9FLOR|nr:TilS [Pterocladiophila hemisphaerica]